MCRAEVLLVLLCTAAAIISRGMYAPVYCRIGDVLVTMERYSEAIDAYESAIAIKPDDPSGHAYARHSYCHLKLGDEKKSEGL